jgi:ABC-type transporter Mla subunit MlaD
MNELQTKLNQIADSLLVQSRLVDRFEGRTEERFAAHEDRLDRIEAALEKLVDAGRSTLNGLDSLRLTVEVVADRQTVLADRQVQTEAALHGLIEQIDRFLRGQQSNGHD